MQAGANHEAIEIGVRKPVPTPVDALGPGEVGYLIAGIKDVADARSGETVTSASGGSDRGAAGLPRPQADGVLRVVPDRRRRLREPARVAGEAEAQRRVDHLHARVVGRARVRLPMRLSRPAAHGDRQGAPRARVRSGAHRHGPERRVPADPHRRHDRSGRQSRRHARGAEDRLDRGAVLQAVDHHADRVHGHADGPVPDPARRDEEDGVPVARTRRTRLRGAARRGGRRLLRPDEVTHEGLRQPRLRTVRLPASRTS